MSKAADAAATAASGAQVVTAAERARRAERAKRSAQLMAWGCDDHKITAPYRTDGNGVANDLYLRNGNLRFLMIGLDAAGKTTICYRLAKSAEVVTTIPTIGFNVETVRLPPSNPKAPGNELVLWDVGGRDKIRPLWRHYYADTHALIFVVDSNDTERLDDRHGEGHGAAQELHHAMDEPELHGKPVLVFANKQDLPHASVPAQVCEALCFPPEACHEAFGADVTGRPAIARDAIPLIRYLLLGDAAFHAASHAASHAADATKRHSPLTAAARAAAQAGPASAAGAGGWLPVAALVTLVVSYIPFATPYLRVIGSVASGADVESLHVGLEWLCDAVYRRAGLDAPRPRPSGGLLSNCTLM